MNTSDYLINNALIGSTGFVGTTLSRQAIFGSFFRSGTISEIAGKKFDCVVCSAAPAQKWIANREPDADLKNIEGLIAHLAQISCDSFVLISTVDVFKRPVHVKEDAGIDEDGLHAYGLHRRMLEKFVQSHFDNHLIVRLPGLVGPGLRKNVIFDFLNANHLNAIDCRSVFQFYPIVNLWYDIQIALKHNLRLVHLTAEPISVEDVSKLGFNKPFDHMLPNPPVLYDMQTHYAELFCGMGPYQYNRRTSLQAIRTYAQSEPHTQKREGAMSQ